jgi:hypothetical protein
MTNQISVITPTTRYRRAKKPTPEWFCSDRRQGTAAAVDSPGKPLPPARHGAALSEQFIEEPSCH